MIENKKNDINSKVEVVEKIEGTKELVQKKFIDKDKNKQQSRITDNILNTITGIYSSAGILILAAIIIFIFSNGWKSLSWELLVSDYNSVIYNTSLTENIDFRDGFEDPNIEGTYFSEKWGVAFVDALNVEKHKIVQFAYVDSRSPMNNMKNSSTVAGASEYIKIRTGYTLDFATTFTVEGEILIIQTNEGAEFVAKQFDQVVSISTMNARTGGGGIRGSIITTIYMILLTLAIALPLGIIAAIYLHEYAKDSKLTRVIRTMIDMTTGIPSIIFGLVGALVFIPMMDATIGSDGGSIASGALTLTIILLPVIIKTSEEALTVIPKSFRDASLALGASKTQTTFKVVLPNALSGILTATILSIGRIIGESAALIYAVGANISDNISVNKKSTTLALHIWSLMGGETPNIGTASAISILILLIVLILAVFVKLVGKKLTKFEVK